MDFLPVFLRLQGQRALVVGGGQVALRKVQMLLRAGACVRLVAPDIHAEVRRLLAQAPHTLCEREFADGLNFVRVFGKHAAAQIAGFAGRQPFSHINFVDLREDRLETCGDFLR
ncbi:MAG: precorrin-2 dehydrogenase/sirohydrochlorin ferrochelatase family protein [Pseudohongiellaceae bacterium]